MNIQVEPNHYFDKSYDTKERFISYWHQVNEIVRLEPDSVLEIGIGSGFVSKYLKEKGESQAATEAKDNSFAKLDAWMREFYMVSRLKKPEVLKIRMLRSQINPLQYQMLWTSFCRTSKFSLNNFFWN